MKHFMSSLALTLGMIATFGCSTVSRRNPTEVAVHRQLSSHHQDFENCYSKFENAPTWNDSMEVALESDSEGRVTRSKTVFTSFNTSPRTEECIHSVIRSVRLAPLLTTQNTFRVSLER